jgi:hydrogenase maturation protein HypF
VERRAVVVKGTVQGVGFRPFIYRLASELRLAGFVRNQSGSVHIEVEGDLPQLDRFVAEIAAHPPRLAHVEDLTWELRPLRGDRGFRVDESRSDGPRNIRVSPDVSTCGSCRTELFDPDNRRYRYPFLNCTDCGPRLTIITGTPYDRDRTTMSGFPMCRKCREEYENPRDRRFHAQPTACAACGPRLELLDANGRLQSSAGDPVAAFAALLRGGAIGALKGLGGFHLACDAGSDVAVRALRERKGREEKPFAIMVRDVDAAAALCDIGRLERRLLESPAAPIVLLRRRKRRVSTVSDAVAPGCDRLGILLPHTPLHHLLLAEMKGIPLVMTSGNRSDEPIATDERVTRQLAGIADAYLFHDRPIHVRCDDSVTRVVAGEEAPIRRSRGCAPEPVRMPLAAPVPILAVGAQLKSTFALGWGDRAILSHHLGDLDHAAAFRAFTRDLDLYESLFGLHPVRIAHDLHPDYASTRYARERAAREGLEAVAVQHHHAHMASCMAENGVTGPVIGVTFDGTGLGTDGSLWGGEFLVGDYREFRRAAHLEPTPMPGGDQAIREPWRMAVAYLLESAQDLAPLEKRIGSRELAVVCGMIGRKVNCPQTSSIGRLFDGVASLCGLRDRISYEGQAAIELEALARRSAEPGRYPVDLVRRDDRWIIRTGPLLVALLKDLRNGVAKAAVARRFHATLVDLILDTCVLLRGESGVEDVVLSGGVFMNELLLGGAVEALRRARFRVHHQRRVPCNDGGICLGQLAVAAAGGGTHSCV